MLFSGMENASFISMACTTSAVIIDLNYSHRSESPHPAMSDGMKFNPVIKKRAFIETTFGEKICLHVIG